MRSFPADAAASEIAAAAIRAAMFRIRIRSGRQGNAHPRDLEQWGREALEADAELQRVVLAHLDPADWWRDVEGGG